MPKRDPYDWEELRKIPDDMPEIHVVQSMEIKRAMSEPNGYDPVLLESVTGYNEVWETNLDREVRFMAHHASYGGSQGSWVSSREEGEAECRRMVAFSWNFWKQRVRDVKADPSGIVIAGHRFYSIGPEPSETELRRTGGQGYGMGGSRMLFRELATNKLTSSRNVWNGGFIPREFHEELPDTHRVVQLVNLRKPSKWEL